jgi:hypothetical protein
LTFRSDGRIGNSKKADELEIILMFVIAGQLPSIHFYGYFVFHAVLLSLLSLIIAAHTSMPEVLNYTHSKFDSGKQKRQE